MKCSARWMLLFFCLPFFASAFTFPADSVQNFKRRKIILASGSGALIAGSLIGLNQAWYKSYATADFHFFDDNNEWLQMDKVGHALTTYQVGRLMMGCMRWAGFSKKQEVFIGGSSGFVYMSAIEIMDGFSKGWGFSWGDMAANTGGSLLAMGQQWFWNEQRISLKFSFHQTSFPQYRPNLLGSSLAEQMLKDYNGQTYWLSCNIASFLGEKTRFPRWLNVAFGYGAGNMIGGDNGSTFTTSDGVIIGANRYRKILFSLDVDLSRIKCKSRFLKAVLGAVSWIKIPFPALEFSQNGVNAHALYF